MWHFIAVASLVLTSRRQGRAEASACCCLQKLTTMQMARCFVRSFPFYPDIPAIAAWISVGERDPVAISKLPIMEAASPANSS